VRRWVPVLIVGSVFTEPHPVWGTPVRSFNAAYLLARWNAWFADHLDPRYASEEISLQWAVADRLALPEDVKDLLDRMYGPMGGGELALTDKGGTLCLPAEGGRVSEASRNTPNAGP
jgi:hypothetical protein